MIPKLKKEVQRPQNCKYFCRNAKKCCRYHKNCGEVYRIWNRLPQSTGKVEILATVMNNMPIPQYIDAMFQTMNTITCEILDHECNNNSKPNRFQFIDSHMIDQPWITNDCKAKFYPVTNCFCKHRSKSSYHISRAINCNRFCLAIKASIIMSIVKIGMAKKRDFM